MAWCRSGDKPLSETMMFILLTHIYASLGLNELVNTLAPGRCCSNLKIIILKLITQHSSLSTHSEIACRWMQQNFTIAGLDIKHLVNMPIGHAVQKIYVPCKNFHVPSQYWYKTCKAYVYCWENKYMPWLKITCPVGHVTTKVYVPWDKIYMPQACGHTLMSSPVMTSQHWFR